MSMTEADWAACLHQMAANAHVILAWTPAEPDPFAARCEQSRHRALAHLRACQATWLEACLAFSRRPNPRLRLLHPWRLFEQQSYDLTPWADHMAAFDQDRKLWSDLLGSTDRSRGGKINGKEHTIESLTNQLVSHELHHLSLLESKGQKRRTC